MTAFFLKIIASLTMLVDHIGAVFPASFPFYFRYIGRIAFPVYAYMIAQGCKRTGNIGKYLLRLGIFALVSEVPFDIAFGNEIDFLNNTNIFYTLFLGTACIAVYKKLKDKWSASNSRSESASVQEDNAVNDSISKQVDNPVSGTRGENEEKPTRRPRSRPARILLSILLMTPIALLGNLLGSDYGTMGVACILAFYFMKPENRLMRTIAAFCVVFYIYGLPVVREIRLSSVGISSIFSSYQDFMMVVPNFLLYFFLFSLISVLLILLYNGKQGPKVKWAFYAFYPGHLAILAAIRYMTEQV